MGEWSADSKTEVVSMGMDDFCSNEKSAVISDQAAGKGKIEFVGTDGNTTQLRPSLYRGVPQSILHYSRRDGHHAVAIYYGWRRHAANANAG